LIVGAAAAPPVRLADAAGVRPAPAAQDTDATGLEVFLAATTTRLPPQNPFGRDEADVRAYLLVRGGEAVLVDTLTPGNAGLLGGALAAAGLGWDALRHVLLTHAHPDHAGSAAAVAALAPGATFWIGREEAPLVPLPGDGRVIQALHDGDEVAGLRVLATPGHSPGHVCVLDPASATLLVGDAAHTVAGPPQLIGPPFTQDPATGAASLGRLADTGAERALFAHGPPIDAGAAAALAALRAALV
jgi:glyoxylase-like metal-dependent hydrolase (beta-lactamase superfamily II)